MSARTINSTGLLLGGLSWLPAGLLGPEGGAGGLAYVVGVLFLVAAFAAGGHSLVSTAPMWLRALVAVATPLLVLSVWQIAVDALPTGPVVLLVGLVLVGVGGPGLIRRPRSAPPARRSQARRRAGAGAAAVPGAGPGRRARRD